MASLHLLFLLPFLFCLQQVNIIFKIVMSYTKLDLSKYRQDVEATCPPCPAPPVHACCGWMHCLYKLNFYLIFSYFYRTRVRSLGMLVTNSLTDWLTHCCLVNLIDVTLVCEDANSKLVEVITVADVDAEDHVSNSLLKGLGADVWFYS